MRIIRCTTISLAVALSACQPSPEALTSADQAAIRAVDSTLVAAINAGDVAAATAAYAVDGMVIPPNMPVAMGADGIRQLWTGLTGMMDVTFAIQSELVSGAGDMAYHVGSYSFSGTMKDSARTIVPREEGKYLQVFVRQGDGSWKVAAEAWNANAPPAPAPSEEQ
jgi:ketosteroid isomerase-like protein